jgi:hypothetical protein
MLTNQLHIVKITLEKCINKLYNILFAVNYTQCHNNFYFHTKAFAIRLLVTITYILQVILNESLKYLII